MGPYALLSLVFALAVTFTFSASSVVDPVIPLGQMQPEHACMFVCQYCFPDDSDAENMIDCSNKVCGPMFVGQCPLERFLWLGHHCRHYDDVRRAWSSSQEN